MRKLFTLVALMAMFLGANAKTIIDAEVDFSKFEDGDASTIKFYGWGASDEAKARLSIKNGCLHFESTEATTNSWDAQFHPIGGVVADEGTVYTLHYKVKGSVEKNISALGFGINPYGQFPITTEWVEGTFDYEAGANPSGDILFQCGDYIGEWDIAYLRITHEEAAGAEEKYKQMLTNGDAETPWADPNVKWNDESKNFTICAWGKQKGTNVNMHEDGTEGSDPFPATIEEDPDKPGNHVFVVHGAIADTDGDAAAWDNQFWIQSPQSWKQGSKVRVKFRYKASQAAHTNTQIHLQNPSKYLHYEAVGDVDFTTEWQDFEKTFVFSDKQAGGWSIAFNLNPENQAAVDFYFDDLSWETVVLEEGFFVTTVDGTTPDYANATPFKEEDGEYKTTVGTDDNYVSEIMISTAYGTLASFKGATIRPTKLVEGEFVDYVEASSAIIKLPGKGIWEITIDPGSKQIAFDLKKGNLFEKLDIKANPAEITLNGKDKVADPWDNQMFIQANRVLNAGEVTYIEFKYKASLDDAKTTTQCHSTPGGYITTTCIGEEEGSNVINFSTEEKTFKMTFTIPNDCAGKDMRTIAFNMAEIEQACDYTIRDVIWKLADDTESLIDETGTKNFFVKAVGDAGPYEFGTDPNQTGINNVVAKKNNSNVKFNIAGQRVSNDYKGMVVDGNGNKYLAK